MRKLEFFTVTRESLKLDSFSQAGCFWKTLPALQRHFYFLCAGPFWRHRDREFFSSFSPASSEHVTPTRGRHTGKKTVSPFSSYIARLIGSFHRNVTPLGRCRAEAVFQPHTTDDVNLADFRFQGALHQVAHSLRRLFSSVKHLKHLFHDGHLDPQPLSQ